MTLREIDSALAAWKSRLAAAASNLTDLEAEPTYQLLNGSRGVPKAPIAGVTAATVEPALEAMNNVFEHFGLLSDTIERASALRRDLPALFGSDQKVREIEELLSGKSIHLPSVTVPIDRRTLLSGVENVDCISPEDLLRAMNGAFEAARDAVIRVSKAWDGLTLALDRSARRIAALRARVEVLGNGALADLDAVERSLSQMRAQVQGDPLGACADRDAQIQPVLARLEKELADKEALQRKVTEGLAASRGLLSTLTSLHQDAMAAAGEARLKIADCGSLPEPLANEKVEGLREWLERLEKKHAEGLLDPVAIGLRNWNSAAEDCVVKERAALAANRAPVATRNELRGRLDALQAKARVYGIAEDDALVELAREAETLLFGRPTPVDRAAAAVAAYETRVADRDKRHTV